MIERELTLNDKYLYYLAYKGAEMRYDNPIPQDILDRIDMEMEVIIGNGFTDYFLIMWDFMEFCRTPERVFELCKQYNITPPPDGIVPIGPGRGSVGGSSVAYCLKIHDCEPIKFGLYFERFLNPERISYPDIDFDISQAYRHIGLKYFQHKYGEFSTSQIITFDTLSARSVVEDLLKVANVSQFYINQVKANMPNDPTLKLKDLDGNEKFETAMRNVVFPDITYDVTPLNANNIVINDNMSEEDMRKVQLVRSGLSQKETITVRNSMTDKKAIACMKSLEKLSKGESAHAAGVILAPHTLGDHMPLMCKADSKSVLMVCQYDMRSIEAIGYLKIDALGLRTVDVNHNAGRFVRQFYDENFDMYLDKSKIQLNDKETLDILKNGDTSGIFQVESSGFTSMMMEIYEANDEQLAQKRHQQMIAGMGRWADDTITEFMWVASGMALYRPGPLDAIIDGKTMVQHIIDRKAGKEPVVYLFPEEEDYLSETFGILAYQEQVINRVRQMTGCTMGRADILRKAMGKKNEVLMKEQMDWFKGEAMSHEFTTKPMTQQQKHEIVERASYEIEKFARYGFNKSHSVEYGIIVYENCYYKTHYPIAFYTALLNSVIDDAKKLKPIIRDMVKHGINLLPPLVNKSDIQFSMTDKDTIRFGLSAISGLSEKRLALLLADRQENGLYTNIEELRARIPGTVIDVNVLTNLVKCGALDDILHNSIMNVQNRATMVGCIPEINKQINKFKQKKKRKSGDYIPTYDEVMEKVCHMTYDVVPVEEDLSEYAMWEKEILNFFISASPIDSYIDEINRWTAITDDVDLDKLPQECYIAGFISAHHETIIKKEGRNKGKAMGFVTVETDNGQYEATCFPGIWETFTPYFDTQEPVVMKVRKDSYKGKTTLQGIYMRGLTKTGIRDCPELHIRITDPSPLAMLGIKQLFDSNKGMTKVFMYVTSGYQEACIETETYIALSDYVIDELNKLGIEMSYKPLIR